jgi:Holliday junction resolvase-like predicted endonuclease
MSDRSIKPSRRGSQQAKAGGILAERYVSDDLATRGFRLLASRYSVPRLGELDLVLLRGLRLLVVEVKARECPDSYGGGLSAITSAKLGRLSKTALHFAQKYGYLNCDISFLAAEVLLQGGKPIGQIHYAPIGMNENMPQ